MSNEFFSFSFWSSKHWIRIGSDTDSLKMLNPDPQAKDVTYEDKWGKASVANSWQNFLASPTEKFSRWEKKFGLMQILLSVSMCLGNV